MQADFSVELGSDDAAMELPWSSADPHVRYYDLKNHPEQVQQIPEALAHPELGSFLSRINAAGFPLATAKCDAWSSMEVAPEEKIFGTRKFVSYIDLVFVNEADRCSFEKHEAFAKDLCRLLCHAPEIAATVELVIRHCHYHQETLACESEIEQSGPPLQQNVNRQTAALEPSDFRNENRQNLNTNERPNSRAKTLQTPVSLDYARPSQKAESEAQFQSKDKFQSEGKIWSKDKVQSKDRLQSEDKVWAEHKVQSEDKVRLKNKPRLEDAIASITGFFLTAYVTGFGDSDHDPVLRWTIGLSLLQHTLVQLTRN